MHVGDTSEVSKAWLLSLDGRWCPCEARHQERGPLWLFKATDGIEGGMSGSPILSDKGAAIGVLSVSGGLPNTKHTDGGPNARLLCNLPGWLLH